MISTKKRRPKFLNGKPVFRPRKEPGPTREQIDATLALWSGLYGAGKALGGRK